MSIFYEALWGSVVKQVNEQCSDLGREHGMPMDENSQLSIDLLDVMLDGCDGDQQDQVNGGFLADLFKQMVNIITLKNNSDKWMTGHEYLSLDSMSRHIAMNRDNSISLNKLDSGVADQLREATRMALGKTLKYARESHKIEETQDAVMHDEYL